MYLQNGNALAASLFKSNLNLGVDLFTDVQINDLICENGSVTGVCIKSNDADFVINSNAVVSAAGGFPHSKALLDQFAAHRAGAKHFSAAVPENIGDIIQMALKQGAAISADYAEAAA